MAKPTTYFNNKIGGKVYFSTTALTVVAGVPTYTSTERTASKVSANLIGDVLSMGELPRSASLQSFDIVGELEQATVSGTVQAEDTTLEVALNGSTIHETLEDNIGKTGHIVWVVSDGTNGYDFAFNVVVGSFSINPDQGSGPVTATIVLRKDKGVTRLAL